MRVFKSIVGAMTVLLLFCLPIPLLGGDLDLPDSIVLDDLAQIFEGAEFDHVLHIEMVDDCTRCHHHTVGIPATNEDCARCHDSEDVVESVACGECHSSDPFSAEYLRAVESDREAYHMDKPGLKAAYHLNCLGCHEEEGGPMDCSDCHERTEAGDEFFHSGRFAPTGESGKTTH